MKGPRLHLFQPRSWVLGLQIHAPLQGPFPGHPLPAKYQHLQPRPSSQVLPHTHARAPSTQEGCWPEKLLEEQAGVLAGWLSVPLWPLDVATCWRLKQRSHPVHIMTQELKLTPSMLLVQYIVTTLWFVVRTVLHLCPSASQQCFKTQLHRNHWSCFFQRAI